jgi:hypothetical protein
VSRTAFVQNARLLVDELDSEALVQQSWASCLDA